MIGFQDATGKFQHVVSCEEFYHSVRVERSLINDTTLIFDSLVVEENQSSFFKLKAILGLSLHRLRYICFKDVTHSKYSLVVHLYGNIFVVMPRDLPRVHKVHSG